MKTSNIQSRFSLKGYVQVGSCEKKETAKFRFLLLVTFKKNLQSFTKYLRLTLVFM